MSSKSGEEAVVRKRAAAAARQGSKACRRGEFCVCRCSCCLGSQHAPPGHWCCKAKAREERRGRRWCENAPNLKVAHLPSEKALCLLRGRGKYDIIDTGPRSECMVGVARVRLNVPPMNACKENRSQNTKSKETGMCGSSSVSCKGRKAKPRQKVYVNCIECTTVQWLLAGIKARHGMQ